jgi:hypothetical protein
MKKQFIFLSLIFLLHAESNSSVRSCKKLANKYYAQLDRYVVRNKQFIRDNECIESSESVIQNSETNQTQSLIGLVNGLHRFYISNIEILEVNTFAGGHTRIVHFFKIKKNGNLSLLKGGRISSEVSEPIIIRKLFNDTIIVSSHYVKTKDKCRYLMKDVFEYKDEEFNKTIEGRVLKKECK